MLPLCIGLFIDNQFLRALTFIVGSITQAAFWILEIAEISEMGWDEFGEYFTGWNLIDFTLPFIYAFHIFLYYENPNNFEDETKGFDLAYNLVTILCIL
jgi:hypothetical protein